MIIYLVLLVLLYAMIRKTVAVKKRKNKRTILVTGGTGYIGSHVVNRLMRLNLYNLIVLDNVSMGSLQEEITLYKGDIRDIHLLDEIFETHKIDIVIHLASLISVSESVTDPLKYYDNNYIGTLRLLQLMKEHNVKYFIFSSSCSVYGKDENTIPRTSNLNPISPYAETKLFIEKTLYACEQAYGIKSVILRYFNVAGIDSTCKHYTLTNHIIPSILKVALNKEQIFYIYGNDYDTRDGTCIRDYIHVNDIADVHISSIDYLLNGGKTDIFHIGSSTGYTVKEVLEECRKITGHSIPSKVMERRAGDSVSLVSSNSDLTNLKWKPKYSSLNNIIKTTWSWHHQS